MACPPPVCLQEAAGLPPSAPGTAQAGSWSDVFEFFELQPATPPAAGSSRAGGSKRRRLAGQARGGAAAGRQRSGQGGANPQEWLPRAEQVVQRFDQQLAKVLAAALDACGGAGGGAAAGPAAAAGVGQQRSGGLAETSASRALVLEPFVQDRWGPSLPTSLQPAGTAQQQAWLVDSGRCCGGTLILLSRLPQFETACSCRCCPAAGVPRRRKALLHPWMRACSRCRHGDPAAARQQMRLPATLLLPPRLSSWVGRPWALRAAAACWPWCWGLQTSGGQQCRASAAPRQALRLRWGCLAGPLARLPRACRPPRRPPPARALSSCSSGCTAWDCRRMASGQAGRRPAWLPASLAAWRQTPPSLLMPRCAPGKRL